MASIKTPRIGALTAEAVMRDYESMAKEIEALGAELISAVKTFEAMTTDVQNTVRDTAEAYRQEGKKIFERIEDSALFSEDVRKTCEDVKRGIYRATEALPLANAPSLSQPKLAPNAKANPRTAPVRGHRGRQPPRGLLPRLGGVGFWEAKSLRLISLDVPRSDALCSRG